MDTVHQRNVITFVYRLIFKYFAYNALTIVIIICTVFLLISRINFSGENVNIFAIGIPQTILSWIGIQDNTQYDASDILGIYSTLSFACMLFSLVLQTLFKQITGMPFKTPIFVSKYLILILISLLFGFTVLSCFLPSAANGSRDIVPVLFIFWIFGIISYTIYAFLTSISRFLD